MGVNQTLRQYNTTLQTQNVSEYNFVKRSQWELKDINILLYV